jgi:ion channel POLLUX/CASTOR
MSKPSWLRRTANRLPMITPRQRMGWDIAVFIVIILCAFEIPYGILVGYQSLAVEKTFDALFFAFFGFDMLLNCMSVRTETHGGLWGWRVWAGLFSKRASPQAQALHHGPARQLNTQPEVAKSYARSGWFAIDLVATIPWSWVLPTASFLGMSRTIRLLRLARLLRLIRLTKGLRALNALRHATSNLPSLGRLLMTLVLLPWLAHLLACVLYTAETDNTREVVTSYGEALYYVFMMLATGEAPSDDLTALGYGVVISGTVLSLLFIGSAIANLAAVFMGMDSRKRSAVQDARTNHTLVLGWNGAIYSVLEQLLSDDEGRSGQIVVLADKDIDEMWHHIGENCVGIKPGSIAIYRGSFDSAALLEDLSIGNAATVILLNEEDHGVDSTGGHGLADVRLLKAILACGQAIGNSHEKLKRSVYGESSRREDLPKPNPVSIVATVSSSNTREILSGGIPKELSENMSLQVVDTVGMTCRVLSQIIVQPVLADVYLDLLSYEPEAADDGAEIYCVQVSEAQSGKTFEALSCGYTQAIPIGYLRQERAVLNPAVDDETPLNCEDTMVLVAPSLDRTTWVDTDKAVITDTQAPHAISTPHDVLVVGAGAKAQQIAHQLVRFLPKGSHVRTWESSIQGIDGQCRVSHLETIGSFRPGESHLIRLVNEGLKDTDEAVDIVVLVPSVRDPLVHDAEILMGLTALEAMWRDRVTHPTVVVDLFDPRNASMVALYNQPVTIVSTALIANYLVQLSQEPDRGLVFHALVDSPEGSELYARPASLYFNQDAPLSFEALALRARAAGEIAIGMKTTAGLTLCPEDRQSLHSAQDVSHLIVVAED